MPTYTYHCENCSHQFDKHQSFSDDALKVCPVCRKHSLRKVYSPSGVVFKGSGFYVTDSRKKASSSTSVKNGKTSKPAKEKAKGTKSENKPAANKKETA